MKQYLQRRRAEERLANLRREAALIDREQLPLDFARLSRKLAELYAERGHRSEAVRWFGQSIDGYLYAGLGRAAAAMCRKLIDFEPRVIRARATLAMLHLAAGQDRDAAEEIRRYVDATRERGEKFEITRHRLRIFAELAEDLDLRALIGSSLNELGDAGGELEVIGTARSPDDPDRREGLTHQERWKRLFDAVVEPDGQFGEAAPSMHAFRS